MRTSTIAPQDVTISFLNNLYSITSNNASNTLSQSVFQTNEQYFSQQDLTFFQQLNGITVQAAELVGGYETSSCSLTADSGNDCFEANLDTQHIMGISQQTLTKGQYNSCLPEKIYSTSAFKNLTRIWIIFCQYGMLAQVMDRIHS